MAATARRARPAGSPAGGTPTAANAPAAAATSPAANAAAAAAPAAPTAEKTFPDRVVEALNAARAVPRSCGTTAFPAAGPLRWNTQTEQAALTQAQYLQQNKPVHAHRRERLERRRPADRDRLRLAVRRREPRGRLCGLRGGGAGLDRQPGHCVNVMNANFVDVGVVLVQGTSSNTYRTYWAMVLGRPR